MLQKYYKVHFDPNIYYEKYIFDISWHIRVYSELKYLFIIIYEALYFMELCGIFKYFKKRFDEKITGLESIGDHTSTS